MSQIFNKIDKPANECGEFTRRIMSLPFYRNPTFTPQMRSLGRPKPDKPETPSEFNKMLDKVRPAPDKVEAVYQYEGEEVGVMIYTTIDGERKLQYVLDPEVRNPHAFAEEVSTLMEFYRHPPRLWPGCRGQVARFLGVEIDRDFNRWFDTLANYGKH